MNFECMRQCEVYNQIARATYSFIELVSAPDIKINKSYAFRLID